MIAAAQLDLLPLWFEYRRTQDARLRDRLVFACAPMVGSIAQAALDESPGCGRMADLVSCGLEALMAAIDRYEPLGGATLEQFTWAQVQRRLHVELGRPAAAAT